VSAIKILAPELESTEHCDQENGLDSHPRFAWVQEMSFPVPPNEAHRLRTLRSYKILDTKPEERFDELTQLAALICGVPISLISLIDSDRQWFKSRFGLDLQETPRAQAFCTHAIMQPEMFVVPDAAQDERFAHNPLVTGDPHIRFYAGAPLAARDGHLLGTICVIDRQPHTLTKEQKTALEILARQVIANIELRSDLKELRDALAAQDVGEHPSEEAEAGLDEVMTKLRSIVSDLQAVRERRPRSS
jgi:GAF domain-containing protein